MNIPINKFYNNRLKEDYHFKDILSADFSKIPNDKRGVYILLSKNEAFLYPNGEKSCVFYIGMSNNLNTRLKSHQKWTIHLTGKLDEKRIDKWYWEKYQYAASFGAEIYIFTTREKQTPKDLESEIIEHFYDKYLGKPVANGAFSFKNK